MRPKLKDKKKLTGKENIEDIEEDFVYAMAIHLEANIYLALIFESCSMLDVPNIRI